VELGQGFRAGRGLADCIEAEGSRFDEWGVPCKIWRWGLRRRWGGCGSDGAIDGRAGPNAGVVGLNAF
jgi:hypothetical protein